MASSRILVVDDEPLVRWSLRERLSGEGHEVIEAATAAEAVERARDDINLIFLDFKLPDGDGLTVLRRVKERSPDVPVILMTAFSTIENAVEAMKLGAFHYVNKPFNLDDVVVLAEKALETLSLRREVVALRSSQGRDYGFDAIVGASPAMTRVKELLGKVAASPASTLLLSGETGTGKDLAAKAVHYNSFAGGPAVRQHHGVGAAGAAARKRALRPRAGCIHRRQTAEARPFRNRRRRHCVPRRNR